MQNAKCALEGNKKHEKMVAIHQTALLRLRWDAMWKMLAIVSASVLVTQSDNRPDPVRRLWVPTFPQNGAAILHAV